MGENSELVELIKQNTAAMNHMVNFVQQQQQQQQQSSSEPKREISVFDFVSSAIKRGILWQIANKRLWGRETSRDQGCRSSVERRETQYDPRD